MHLTTKELRAFLGDELPQSETQEIEQHLSDCHDCRQAISRIVDSVLTTDDEEESVSGAPTNHSAVETTEGDLPGNQTLHHSNKIALLGNAGFDFGQRFLLQDEIGHGGMGVIYRGFDRELKREVAIKISKGTELDELAVRFYREAQISAQLQHPGIVPVHQTGYLNDGRRFIAMKLVKGQTLQELLDEPGQPQQLSHYKVFEDICNSMAFAHSRNIVHRDLKPENVMVGEFGEVQIMDWGLAKKLPTDNQFVASQSTDKQVAPMIPSQPADPTGTRSAASPIGTQDGQVIGTPAYMSPEQSRGEWVDKRTDVFAIGGILFQILTGKAPFDAPTATVALKKSIENDLSDAFSKLDAADCDTELIAITKSCLAANVDQRPADATEVNQMFADYMANREKRMQSAKLDEARTRERLIAQKKRNRQIIGFGSAVIAAMVLAGISGFMYFSEKNARISEQAELERARLQERIERENAVRNGMASAIQFQRLAEIASQDGNTDNWVAAINEIEKANTFASQLTDGELKSEFDSLADQIKTAGEASFKNKEYMLLENACVEELETSCIDSTIHPGIRPYLDCDVIGQIEQAFEKIGIVEGNVSAEALQRLSRSEFKDELMFGLLTWAKEASIQKQFDLDSYQESTKPWLEKLIQELDDDPFRNEVRTAARTRDLDRLEELIQQEQATQSLWDIQVCSAVRTVVRDKEALLKYLTRAHQNFPKDFHINWNLAGVADLIIGPYDERKYIAIQHYLICYSLQPDHANVLLNVGGKHSVNENPEAAVEVLERLVELAPEFPMSYRNLCIVNMTLKNYELALEQSNKVLELTNNQDFNTLAVRAELNFRVGNIKRAIGDCESALKINPNAATVHENLANILHTQGKTEAAIESLERAHKLEPDFEAHRDGLVEFHVELAARYQAEDDFEQASQMLTKAISYKPDDMKLKRQLGGLYVAAENWDSAREIYEAILQADQTNSPAVVSLASLLLAQSKPREAELQLREAIINGINSQSMQFELAKALIAQSDSKKKQEGVSILRALARLAPDLDSVQKFLQAFEGE